MKRILLLIFILFSDLVLSQGRWHKLLSASSTRFEDISFLNDSTLVICDGDGGRILRSRDAGYTWEALYTGNPKYYLRSIEYFDKNTIICGTLDSVILGSFDGGHSWEKLDLPKSINGICGMDVIGGRIYATGNVNGGAYVLSSDDGGHNWTYKDLNHLADYLIDIYFTDRDTGYASGSYIPSSEGYLTPIILKTVNGGQDWFVNYISTDSVNGYVWKIFPLNTRKLYASIQSFDDIMYLQSSDGGENWQERIVSVDAINMQGIGFLNDTTGWFGTHKDISISLPTFFQIDIRANAAISVDDFSYAGINRMHKVNDSIIYAVGEGGVFAYFDSATTDLRIPEVPDHKGLPPLKVTMKLYPNPIQNELLKLEVNYPFKMQSNIYLLDIRGRLIDQLHRGYVEEGKKEFIYSMEGLPSGEYLIFENSYEGPEILKFIYRKQAE